MECMTEEETEKRNTIEEIIETEKRQTERERAKEKTRQKSLRATQGFVYHPGPPAIPLPFGDDTVKCSIPSLGEQDKRS